MKISETEVKALSKEVKALMEKYKIKDFVLVAQSGQSAIHFAEANASPLVKNISMAIKDSLLTLSK